MIATAKKWLLYMIVPLLIQCWQLERKFDCQTSELRDIPNTL